MKGILEKWAEMHWYDRVAFVTGLVSCAGIIVFGLLGIINAMADADRYYIPLAAVAMLAQGFQDRKRSRFMMIVSLAVGVFLAVLSVLMFALL